MKKLLAFIICLAIAIGAIYYLAPDMVEKGFGKALHKENVPVEKTVLSDLKTVTEKTLLVESMPNPEVTAQNGVITCSDYQEMIEATGDYEFIFYEPIDDENVAVYAVPQSDFDSLYAEKEDFELGSTVCKIPNVDTMLSDLPVAIEHFSTVSEYFDHDNYRSFDFQHDKRCTYKKVDKNSAFGSHFDSDSRHFNEDFASEKLELTCSNAVVRKMITSQSIVNMDLDARVISVVNLDVTCEKNAGAFRKIEWIPKRGETSNVSLILDSALRYSIGFYDLHHSTTVINDIGVVGVEVTEKVKKTPVKDLIKDVKAKFAKSPFEIQLPEEEPVSERVLIAEDVRHPDYQKMDFTPDASNYSEIIELSGGAKWVFLDHPGGFAPVSVYSLPEEEMTDLFENTPFDEMCKEYGYYEEKNALSEAQKKALLFVNNLTKTNLLIEDETAEVDTYYWSINGLGVSSAFNSIENEELGSLIFSNESGLDLDVSNAEVVKIITDEESLRNCGKFVVVVSAEVTCNQNEGPFEDVTWIPDEGDTQHVYFILCMISSYSKDGNYHDASANDIAVLGY